MQLPTVLFRIRSLNTNKGCHSRNACTTICDRGQNALTDLDRKFLSFHFIGITILGITAEISLDLFYRKHQRNNYSGLTVDYGKYFKLTVGFCFDRGRIS